MSAARSFIVHAGARAADHVRNSGLAPADIDCVPAAAGGPKGLALTKAELLAHCSQHLTGYKVPKAIELRTEPLPKTSIGKILRRELRTPAAA